MSEEVSKFIRRKEVSSSVYISLQLMLICKVRFIHVYQKNHCHRKEHSLALCSSVQKDLYRWQEM